MGGVPSSFWIYSTKKGGWYKLPLAYPFLSHYDFKMKRDPLLYTKIFFVPFTETMPQVIEQSLFLFLLRDWITLGCLFLLSPYPPLCYAQAIGFSSSSSSVPACHAIIKLSLVGQIDEEEEEENCQFCPILNYPYRHTSAIYNFWICSKPKSNMSPTRRGSKVSDCFPTLCAPSNPLKALVFSFLPSSL